MVRGGCQDGVHGLIVALFGPTSPIRTGPYGNSHHILTQEISCRPCFRRSRQNALQMECLVTISPRQVIQAVKTRVAVRQAQRACH